MNLPSNKDELVTQLHQQIDEASRNIDELKLQANLAKAEARSAFEANIATLESQKVKLQEQVNHLKHSTDNAWQELAEGCQKSWHEFQSAVQKAIAQFKA
ncbi:MULTISPECIES: hypothetical protein [Cyanophyceae]|uniref:hypothetical protein n=1 Tax=Cyanophyceae TaxID=3028117 RepID=UPI00016DCCD6|nr:MULTISPECIES: hypothetical protein [Cyanophyceae]ACA99469.1 conserved hypothetical protein [Picosynechococcus sp. PCC 7002]SMH30628.1 hypothetical protein SAMN06272755_0218 [Picosynechococcus sp. OG1]SMQ83938.1 hypothetical protein SAMN06272774_2594 [Synechococcus sp. 7002]